MTGRKAPNTARGRSISRIVILGGGYAALAAASKLQEHASECRVILIAPRKAHIRLTHLHETVRVSLSKFCVPYAQLGKRFGFHFIQGKLRFDVENLYRWEQRRSLLLGDAAVPFDCLLIATGAGHTVPEAAGAVLGVNDFCLNQGAVRIEEFARHQRRGQVSVVGAGATGIQFLFELSHYLKHHGAPGCRLRLVDSEPRILGQFPKAFHDCVVRRLDRQGIDYVPNTAFRRQEGSRMLVMERDTGREFAMPSDLTLVFLGARPNPLPIATNAYGQVLADGEPLEHVFAAGDCAHFQGGGANTLSAQVAVRKGGTVAGNLLSQVHADQKMQPYRYRERGYFVSLGPLDGIGWLGDEGHVLTGIRAFAVKAMVDAQLDLLLDGIDTYRV